MRQSSIFYSNSWSWGRPKLYIYRETLVKNENGENVYAVYRYEIEPDAENDTTEFPNTHKTVEGVKGIQVGDFYTSQTGSGGTLEKDTIADQDVANEDNDFGIYGQFKSCYYR